MADTSPGGMAPNDPDSPFVTVPIEVVVVVGKARPLVRELVGLGENAVLALDRRVEDPVELYVGDRLVARGMLEEIEGDPPGQLAVRLTEIADMRNAI